MSDWISVEANEAPFDDDWVLVFANDIVSSWVDFCFYTDQGWCHYGENGIEIYSPIITHWQPLPEPPVD